MYHCLPVRPHLKTRLPLNDFSWNLTFEYFSKVYRENSSFIKILQEHVNIYDNVSLSS
jgi:hypothetical protein